MKRFKIDFGYGRYFFDEKPEGDWVKYEDAQAELQQLRAILTQAPIAKITVREGCMANAPDDVHVSLYAPGLPPGEHDVYLMPQP